MLTERNDKRIVCSKQTENENDNEIENVKCVRKLSVFIYLFEIPELVVSTCELKSYVNVPNQFRPIFDEIELCFCVFEFSHFAYDCY